MLCGSAVSLLVPSPQQASEVRFSNLSFVDRSERNENRRVAEPAEFTQRVEEAMNKSVSKEPSNSS